MLESVDIILAEDTRKTKILLDRYEISTRMETLEMHREGKRVDQIVDRLRTGISMALVSDAGTPTISDPGHWLVACARAAQIPVVSIPGPSSVTAALSISGLPANQFLFGGFFPKKWGEAEKWIIAAGHLGASLVFFESPKRIVKTLTEIVGSGLASELMVAREITKQFETSVFGIPADVVRQIQMEPIKGEFVIVMKVKKAPEQSDTILAAMAKANLTSSQRVIIGKAVGLSRNVSYAHTI